MTPRPYVAATFAVHDANGKKVLSVALEDDMAGLVRIVGYDDDCEEVNEFVLVNTDEVPAMIQALRMVLRDDARAKREMRR